MDSKLPHFQVTGILQPLTSVSMILTLIRPDLSLTLEKLLQFSNLTQDDKKNHPKVEIFIQKSVQHIFKGVCGTKYGKCGRCQHDNKVLFLMLNYIIFTHTNF